MKVFELPNPNTNYEEYLEAFDKLSIGDIHWSQETNKFWLKEKHCETGSRILGIYKTKRELNIEINALRKIKERKGDKF